MLRQGMTSSLEAEVWYLPEEGDTAEPPYLEGPINPQAKTLNAKYHFRPAQLDNRPAWKTIIPEPCLWSVQTPAVYALHGGAAIIGLRDLHLRGESFYQEDRRWVIRAARGTYTNDRELLAHGLIPIYRRSNLGNIEGSRCVGLPSIIWPEASPLIELDLLSRYPNVMLVVLPQSAPDEVVSKAHSHLPLGAEIDPRRPIPEWARFAVVSEEMIRDGWQPDRRLPVVVTRQCQVDELSGEEVRARCDTFQASLPKGADFAGLWLICELYE